MSYSDFILPLFDQTDYSGYNKLYKWKCVKCRK